MSNRIDLYALNHQMENHLMEIEIWAIMITDSIKRELKLFRIPDIQENIETLERCIFFTSASKQKKRLTTRHEGEVQWDGLMI